MPRERLSYLFIGLAIVIVFFLGVVADALFFRERAQRRVSPAVLEDQPSKEGKISLPEATKLAPEKEQAPQMPTKEQEPPLVAETSPAKMISKPEFQKGMNYVAWTEKGYGNPSSLKSMEQLAALGVEWVGLVSTWYQDRYNSTDIYPKRDKTPTDDSLIFAIRKLHELKFKVMLKPHLDLIEGDGKWRGDISFDSDAERNLWFDNYSSFLLHYAQLAVQENVELLCIGTELTQSTLSQPQRWKDLIRKIKEIYQGQLTYAANWHAEFSQIEFWDALDYAGIDPYFPLICTARPSVEELKSAWKDWMVGIEAWQKKINKPVIITEIGYKSSMGSTEEPWQYTGLAALDLELQVNSYRALLETFWDKPWFYGAYWWYWGTHPMMGGLLNKGFTPQNKPAQEVIKEWHSKPISEKAY